MGIKIRVQNEKALGCLRELSRYLTVSRCTAGECLEGALDRIKADRPELRKELDRIIKSFSAAANECAP